MDKEEYDKAYGYALAQEKVEIQLEIAGLEAEQTFLKSKQSNLVPVAHSIDADDFQYNERRLVVLEAKLNHVKELEGIL